MPWADYSKQLASNRRYAQTPAGRAAKARSHRNYIEKRRRESLERKGLAVDAKSLEQVMKEWTR
jgi:hypothetical protein